MVTFQRESLGTPSSIFGQICSTVGWCRHDVLDATLEIAIEIAREGREGRRIGTLFTLGSADAVLASSRALILDPLAGHAPAATHITDQNLRGTVKELAQLDGAFVVSDDGTVVAACRYLDAIGIPRLTVTSLLPCRPRHLSTQIPVENLFAGPEHHAGPGLDMAQRFSQVAEPMGRPHDVRVYDEGHDPG